MPMPDSLIYNDYVKAEKKRLKALLKKGGDEIDHDAFYSEAFFKLANTEQIGYRISDTEVVHVKQNVNASDTTGGIVWESAYLLLDYLVKSGWQKKHATVNGTVSAGRSTVIDLGAGTGLLGLSLSRLHYIVTVTEYNEPGNGCLFPSSIFSILQGNVERHNKSLKIVNGDCKDTTVKIHALDWSESVRDIHNWTSDSDRDGLDEDSKAHEFDLVVGTDVLFSPDLVLPLLKTASVLTKPLTGTCIFCMQIRCRDSHQLFLESVKEYFDFFRDVSEEVYATAGCAWGRHVECLVFEMKGGRRQCASLPSLSAESKKRKGIGATDCPGEKKKKSCC